MDLFSLQPGAVVAVDSPGIPMGLFLEGWEDYPAFKAIVTGFQMQTTAGVQFMHTLQDFIYVYVFGERIAPVTITGMTFAHSCDRLDENYTLPPGQTFFFPSYHGLE